MSGIRNTAIPFPSTVAPLVDENGQLTMAWRAWFQQIQRRWTSGTGPPATVVSPDPLPISGSLYSRTDGTVGARLYVAQGNGAWLPVPGV
jgi:hypothetical protein